MVTDYCGRRQNARLFQLDLLLYTNKWIVCVMPQIKLAIKTVGCLSVWCFRPGRFKCRGFGFSAKDAVNNGNWVTSSLWYKCTARLAEIQRQYTLFLRCQKPLTGDAYFLLRRLFLHRERKNSGRWSRTAARPGDWASRWL